MLGPVVPAQLDIIADLTTCNVVKLEAVNAFVAHAILVMAVVATLVQATVVLVAQLQLQLQLQFLAVFLVAFTAKILMIKSIPYPILS